MDERVLLMHHDKSRVLLIAALVVLPGCRTDSNRSADVVRRDSAGVVIIENAASRANTALAWTIDSVPNLNIGAVEGAEHYQLFRVSGVALLSDGRIVVVNAGSQELRFFDRQGVFHSSVGSRGEGPGEYQFPMLVPAFRYDTLWVFDRGRRLTVLDDRGQLLRTIAPRSRLSEPVGIWAGKLVTSQGSARARPDTPEGMMPNDIVYEFVDLETESHDTIAQFEGFALFLSNIGGGIGFTPVPFDVGPSAGIGRDLLYVTPGEAAEVRAFDSAGALREIIRIAQPAQSISQAAFDGVIAAEIAKADNEPEAAELRRRYSKMPRPSVMPVFQGLLVDAGGNLWLEAFRADNDKRPEWVVIDSRGNVLGHITSPRNVTITQIGDDYILGLTRDDTDVEHIVRHQLYRR